MLMREEIDVRIVFEQQRQHRSPRVTASIVDRHEHGDARALDQSPQS